MKEKEQNTHRAKVYGNDCKRNRYKTKNQESVDVDVEDDGLVCTGNARISGNDVSV